MCVGERYDEGKCICERYDEGKCVCVNEGKCATTCGLCLSMHFASYFIIRLTCIFVCVC